MLVCELSSSAPFTKGDTLKITVRMSDGSSLEAEDIKPGDMVRFERQFGISFSDLYVEKTDADGNAVIDPTTYEPVRVPSPESRIEHTLFLAYAALKRTQQFTGTFDDFLDGIDDFDAEDEAVPLGASAA